MELGRREVEIRGKLLAEMRRKRMTDYKNKDTGVHVWVVEPGEETVKVRIKPPDGGAESK